MTRSGPVSRRTALKVGAGAVALPLVHIRTAGAAGKLKTAFTTNFTPGADAALRNEIERWGAQTKTEVQVDFLSQTPDQMTMTLAAEAEAKSGHDVVRMGYAAVTTYARFLEPADDVVMRLQRTYGPINQTAEYCGRVDGHWAVVPGSFLSPLLPCVGRIDIFKQQVGMNLQQVFPAKPEMGPGYDQWTWDAFLQAAERCAKANLPFGLPISACDDGQTWLGMLFRSYGAELVDAQGKVVVNSEAVRTVLEYMKRIALYLPDDVYSWDNASNNRALISGRSALILNPPSAWAQAVKDQLHVGSQCWHFPPPAGPKGRFLNYFPAFYAIWSFSPNKGAAKELIEWLSQREQVEKLCVAGHGFDIPPFLSMSDFKIWEDEGPPKGTLSNYPIKPAHHVIATLPTYPAPLGMALPMYNLAIMPNMVAMVTHGGHSIEESIAWAQRELEGLRG
jgi:ABC-type glycerol-3-phosphate transport system substrate-binding protein